MLFARLAPEQWARIGVPQEDGADTDYILGALEVGRYSTKPETMQPDGGPVWPDDGPARWALTLPEAKMPGSGYALLPTTDAIVQEGLALLRLWPGMERQCAHILRALVPMTSLARAETRGQGRGCSCGHVGDDYGWIYVTADDAWGFAEGIVHEMGHWKLRALSIWFEEWTDDILLNDPEERYESPVRKDILRPMGAVLHAQYSYIHVAQMAALILDSLPRPTKQDADWTALQVARITEGRTTVNMHARGSAGRGAEFLRGIDEWTGQVIAAGQQAVEAAQGRMAAEG